RSQAAGIGAAGVILSVSAFIGLPRDIGANLLGGLHMDSRNRQTQFINQVDLITGGGITRKQVRVVRVQRTGGNGPAVEADHPLLLRGGVCDRYEGQGRWRPANERLRRMSLLPLITVPLGGATSMSVTGGQSMHVRFLRPSAHVFAPM